mgnify:CR=1 FL=1
MNNIPKIIGDRLILNSEVHDYFRTSVQERLDCGIDMMNIPGEKIETIYCSSLNKHTCIQHDLSIPDKSFLVVDEHLHEVLSSLLLLFYMFGYHDYKYYIVSAAVGEALILPQKRLNLIAVLLQAEKYLLDGNATAALLLANKFKDYSSDKENKDELSGLESELERDYFLIKYLKVQHAMPYVANFYIFHELAHVKLSLDLDLRRSFFKLVENQITNLCIFEDKVGCNVVDVALLPKEDIACDAYALFLLFNFIYEKTANYDFEFMVDSYIFSVLSLTELDTILERTISITDWQETSWWRIFIALEIVYLCEPANDKLRKGIIETRAVARNKYDNYVELLECISHNIESALVKEKYFMFSTKWKDEVNQALSIIREMY